MDYVLDRQVADLHILVTWQSTGAGGAEYTLFFMGRGDYEAKSDTLKYIASPDDTSERTRAALVDRIRMGLVRYLAGRPESRRLRISMAEEAGNTNGGQVPRTRDPWNNRVFQISGNGYLNGESQQRFSNYGLRLSANRTTDRWKVRLNGDADYSASTFDVDSVTTVKSFQRAYSGSALIAGSVARQLSAGVEASLQSSTFSNVKFALRVAPALEYDFFPYNLSTRRSLTVLYTVGFNTYRYAERTIFDELRETRPAQTLGINYSTREAWGSVSLGLSSNEFLHDLSKYSWSASAGADVRLFKGLSLNLFGDYGRVRDQLAVEAGAATHDEILLRQRLLRTNYSYYMSFGLSYRFGSIFSTVVNPRFNDAFNGSFLRF